jgi:hypothetical protein
LRESCLKTRAAGHTCDEYSALENSYPLNGQAKKRQAACMPRPHVRGKVKKQAVPLDRAFLPFFCWQQLDY